MVNLDQSDAAFKKLSPAAVRLPRTQITSRGIRNFAVYITGHKQTVISIGARQYIASCTY